MNTGAMRHKIIIEALTETRNSSGGEKFLWQKVCDVQSEIIPLSGRALFAAQQNHSEVTGIIKMRFRADITAKMRAVYNNKIYSIHAPINVGERNKELHLMVSEGVRES